MTKSSPKLSPEAKELFELRGMGPLADKMGFELLELSAEHSVATMPVEGNTQPLGYVHGGAYVVLAESLGSFSANVWAHTLGKVAVGIEVNASHSRSATEGLVTATCRALQLGRSLTIHEIICQDDQGRRLSTVRITNFLKDKS